MKPDFQQAVEQIQAFALALPGAHEDFPWGERVVKVGKKVFVFLGKSHEGGFGMSVKLPKSLTDALEMPFCAPTGYGLGKAGWVSASLAPEAVPPVDLFTAWIEESYRAIAPKKLIKELDARRSG